MHIIRGLGARPTLRFALAALATGACGEDIDISTGESLSSTSTSSSATTEDASTAPTTETPTTSSGTSSTSGGTVGADDSSTGDTSTSTGASETGSSETGEDSSTGETGASSSSTGSSTGETGSSTSTGDESSSSTGDEVFACGAPPMPDQSQPPQTAGCSQVDESLWCLTLGNGNVTAVGLDSQSSCPVAQLQTDEIEVFAVGSIGVVGSDVFTCTTQFDGLVARISLIDGAVEVSPTPCSAVTVWRGRIIVQDDTNDDLLDIYDSWADVMLGQVLWSFNPPGIFSETLTSQADVLYAAWHSDNQVDRFQLPCGEPLGPVMFEGFDNWMQGIAVSEDLRFLTFGFSYEGVVAFDAGTGAALPAFPGAPIDGVGLACFIQP